MKSVLLGSKTYANLDTSLRQARLLTLARATFPHFFLYRTEKSEQRSSILPVLVPVDHKSKILTSRDSFLSPKASSQLLVSIIVRELISQTKST
jgi:hypothetical protein